MLRGDAHSARESDFWLENTSLWRDTPSRLADWHRSGSFGNCDNSHSGVQRIPKNTAICSRRDGRVAECASLLMMCPGQTGPRVRIPLSPHHKGRQRFPFTAFFLFLHQADVSPVHATANGISDFMLRVTSHIEINESEFEFSFARSGGPGGQNVNKVSSKAVLRWDITRSQALPAGVRRRFLDKYHNRVTRDGMLVLHSQRYRDQGRNVADCMDRLREMILQVATPPIKRRQTKPTKGSQQRRIQNKKQNSDKKKMRRRPSAGD